MWALVPALGIATNGDLYHHTADPYKTLQEKREDVLPNEDIFVEGNTLHKKHSTQYTPTTNVLMFESKL